MNGQKAVSPVSDNETELSILKCRARILALEPEKGIPASELLNVLIFSLCGESYAIEAAFVREVYQLKEFTQLPGVPEFILGIINVRGQILSVIELNKLFGITTTGIWQLNKVIILHDAQMEFGILADEIVATRSLLKREIQTSIPTISGIRATFLQGVTAEHIIVLDGERILGDKSIVLHQK